MDQAQFQMDPAQFQQAVAEWLDKKWSGSKSCPICQTNRWNIGNFSTVGARLSDRGIITLSGYVIPAVDVVCDECGYTIRFNTVIMGVDSRRERADRTA